MTNYLYWNKEVISMNEKTKTYVLLFASGFFATMLVLTTINIVYGQMNLEIPGMYEDQFLICDFREKCVIIDIDDYMDKETSENIYRLFNEDLDTFPIQALD